MAVNSYPVVTGLTGYVDGHILDLRYRANMGTRAAETMTIQTGVKSQALINVVNTVAAANDAKACGFTSSETTLSARTLSVGNYKWEEEICVGKLLNTWAGFRVRNAAGFSDLPFEEVFVGEFLNKISNDIDKKIWSGASTGSVTSAQVAGILPTLVADSHTAITTLATTKWGKVQDLIAAFDAEVAGPVRLYCSPAFARGLALELVNLNLYHYKPEEQIVDFVIPGTDIILTPTVGLKKGAYVAGDEWIVISAESNLIYGVDMEGDAEEFKLWYSEDNDTIRIRVKANAGANYAFADSIEYLQVED